jgi:hypothetical protein
LLDYDSHVAQNIVMHFERPLLNIAQVGALTAAELAAEKGNVGRFGSAPGLKPAVLQPRKQTGENLAITKKGNAKLPPSSS